MANASCVTYARYPAPGTYHYLVGNYVFPIVFAVGVSGNALNLIVLNRMRIKCKRFLSAMAAADLCFFSAMFALNLSIYDRLALSTKFMRFYYDVKVTLVVLANWFSSSSIWLAIMVTAERLTAIRTPIRARTLWTPFRSASIVALIFVSTFSAQVPHFVWYEPNSMPDCANRSRSVPVLLQLSQSHAYYQLVKVAITICPMIVVTVPLILLISLNALLIYYLKLSRSYVRQFETLGNSRRSKDNERQIAVMISVIVGTFFVFNFPSAVVFVVFVFERDPHALTYLVAASVLTNQMVTVHKIFNFPLYCLSSSNFRRNLKRVFSGECANFATDNTTNPPTTMVGFGLVASLKAKNNNNDNVDSVRRRSSNLQNNNDNAFAGANGRGGRIRDENIEEIKLI